MNAPSKIAPAIPADPRHMAKSIVRSLPLTKCAELLVALKAEIGLELQDGWQTEDGEMAEGSLEGAAAETALESFELYVKSLRHPDDEREWAA